MRITPASPRRRSFGRRTRVVVGTLALTLAASPALSSPAAATTQHWVEGTSDSDTVLHCINQTPATGVMASVAWRPVGDAVPRIGARFYVRMTAGLVGPSCYGVSMFVEMMAPRGLIYGDDAKHPVRWGIRDIDQPVNLRPGGLSYHPGSNAGVVLLAGNNPFILSRGQVLEIDVPVIATKVMKGKATREPECENRRRGVAPCPVSEAGDHFQAAFRVGGHGGNKTYVTPYVGLFAQAAASRTTAAYTVSRKKKGTARVKVTSAARPTGTVMVRDRGRTIARKTLTSGHRGTVTITLPRLKKGAHRLSTRYYGSGSVAASTSSTKKIRIR